MIKLTPSPRGLHPFKRLAALAALAAVVVLNSGLAFVPLAGWPASAQLPAAPLVFVSDRDGSSQIYSTVPGESSLVKLTSGRAAREPDVSPDGRRVVYGMDDDWPFFESILAVSIDEQSSLTHQTKASGCSVQATRGLSSRAIQVGGDVTVTLDYDVACTSPTQSDVVLAVSGVFGDQPANADMPLTAAVREGIFSLTNHVTWSEGSRVGLVVMQQDATKILDLSGTPGEVLEALSQLWIVSGLTSTGATAALDESRALLDAGGAGEHGRHVVLVSAAESPLSGAPSLADACSALRSVPASLHVLDIAAAAWPSTCDLGQNYHLADSASAVVALLDQVGSEVFSAREPQLIAFAERLTDGFSLVEGVGEPPSEIGPAGWLTWTLEATGGDISYELRADAPPGLHRTASESRLRVVLDGQSYEQTLDLGDICVYPTGQPERCSTFATATPVGAELTPATPTQPTPTRGPTNTPRVKDETPTGTPTRPDATPATATTTSGPPAHVLFLPAALAEAPLR